MRTEIIDGQTVYLINDKQEWEKIFSSGYFLDKPLSCHGSNTINVWKKKIFTSIDKKLTNICHGLALPFDIPPYREQYWVYHFLLQEYEYYRVECAYPTCSECFWTGYAISKYPVDSIYGFTDEHRYKAYDRNKFLKIVNCPCCATPFDSRRGIVFTDSCENRIT